MDDLDSIDGYIGTQYGLINRTQGIAFYGEAAFKRQVRDGDVVRELNGLYRVRGAPTSPEQQLYLATFAYNGVASHKGAGGLRGFERCAGLQRREPRNFDPGDSAPELRVRRWLDQAGLPPTVQHPVIVDGVRRTLDLSYPPERVAVEYHGLDPHGLPSRVLDDAKRTTELQLAGWIVVIVTKKTTKREAIEMVRTALRLRGRDVRPR